MTRPTFGIDDILVYSLRFFHGAGLVKQLDRQTRATTHTDLRYQLREDVAESIVVVAKTDMREGLAAHLLELVKNLTVNLHTGSIAAGDRGIQVPMISDAIRLILITVPPEEVCAEIDLFRREVSRIGDCREALTYPPHITMRTGALVPPDALGDYGERLRHDLAGTRPFPVETISLEQSSYTADGALRFFVGYGIRLSEELRALNQRLLEFRDWIKSDRTDFQPHLTVAFHDLDEAGAGRVARWIAANPDRVPSGFRWTCDNLGLWRRGDEAWEPFLIIRF